MMEILVVIFLLIIIITYSVTSLVIPKVIRICKQLGIKESPQKRKQHKKPMIQLGGIGLLFSFQVSLLAVMVINSIYNLLDINNILIIKIQLFSFIISMIGILDDIIDLSAYTRLIGQFSIAFLTWLSGVKIESLHFNLLDYFDFKLNLSVSISCIITLIWIVGIINAINWVDGIDGLASSQVIISSIGFIILSYLNNQSNALILSTALLGSCLSFLKYNYNPAKIFMGDGGSNFLGYNLALIGILYSSNTFFSMNPFQISLIIAIPIYDMTLVIIRRLISGNSPFLPDRGHFHHILISKGFSQKNIVNFSLLISIICVSAGILINPSISMPYSRI